jgi:WD40 repeat protein
MTVRLWNATTGAWKRTAEGHRGQVCAIAFSPDGKIFASDGVALGFHYWRGTLKESKPTSLLFSEDGRYLK